MTNVGDDIVVLTWLDHVDRQTPVDASTWRPEPLGDRGLRHPLGRPAQPIGLDSVRITAVTDVTITVARLEALDGTPILDVKPMLGSVSER